jgi:hypothetical protein
MHVHNRSRFGLPARFISACVIVTAGLWAQAVLAQTPKQAEAPAKAPASEKEIRVFTLKYTGTDVCMPVLTTILQGSAADGVRIGSDQRTNSLIVMGPPQTLAVVADILTRIDVPPSKAPAPEKEVKIISLVNAQASDLATTLMKIFEGSSHPLVILPMPSISHITPRKTRRSAIQYPRVFAEARLPRKDRPLLMSRNSFLRYSQT